MKNETIKTYTEITPLDGLKLLVENDGEQVDGLAFWNTFREKWQHNKLAGCNPTNSAAAFTSQWGWSYSKCAKVKEIDPCKSPDGCPELEPWMAYVGTEPEEICNNPMTEGWPYWIKWNDENNWDYGVDGSHDGKHHAIDVRTEWSKEHFPEHCRIRNYQEPDQFEEWFDKSDAGAALSYSPYLKHLMRQAYELGQANAK